jgi:CRISPR/Cas system Type II protein with McrA/HNH and RuvC-like nuclease domain
MKQPRTILGQNILKLRSQGFTYGKIVDELKCPISTVSYYCGQGQKEKAVNRSKKNKKSSLTKKINGFYNDYSKFKAPSRASNWVKKESYEEDIKFLKSNPYCYITGEKIDLDKTETYSLDHIIPLSRGGARDIKNMGLTTRMANQAKNAMIINEFIELCEKVLTYHGYKVVK